MPGRAEGWRLCGASSPATRPRGLVAWLRELNLGVDIIATSDDRGLEKPSVGFIERRVQEAGSPSDQVLYVGDRLDNDILPATSAALRTAHPA